MNNADDEILSILSRTLELPPGYELAGNTMIGKVPGWDSLTWVNVITAIESYCQGEFPIEKIDDLHSISDLVKVISELKSAQ
jgi:acyl carrier protein